jgi:hypothetical protein
VGSLNKPSLLLQSPLWSAVLEMHKPVPVKGYGKGGITHTTTLETAMPGNYTQYNYWSPILGTNACRLSMRDARGSEFFAIVPRVDGKAWKDIRIATLTMIQEAIDSGNDPGPASDVGLHIETETYPDGE